MFIYFSIPKILDGKEPDSCPCCELAEQSGRQAGEETEGGSRG